MLAVTFTRYIKVWGNRFLMRWKLILIVSSITAGLLWAIAMFSERFGVPYKHLPYFILTWFAILTISSSIYIYRHTPRQRKIQAALTALFIVLFFCIITVIIHLTGENYDKLSQPLLG